MEIPHRAFCISNRDLAISRYNPCYRLQTPDHDTTADTYTLFEIADTHSSQVLFDVLGKLKHLTTISDKSTAAYREKRVLFAVSGRCEAGKIVAARGPLDKSSSLFVTACK